MAVPANGYKIKKNGAGTSQGQGSPFPVPVQNPFMPQQYLGIGHQSGVHQIELNAGDVIKITRDTSSDLDVGQVTSISTNGLNDNAATLTIKKIADLPVAP